MTTLRGIEVQEQKNDTAEKRMDEARPAASPGFEVEAVRGAAPGPGLSAADFTRIAAGGFGDPQNAYCHAMEYFQGQTYVGTTRHSMALLKMFPPAEPPAMDPWPVRVPASVQDLDMRGQVWRWDPQEERWENVYRSPIIPGKNGQDVPRDLGYRGMAVFQGRSDPQPALYVASMSTVLRGTAAHILRSADGVNFTPVSEPGLGNPKVSTFRSLSVFDNHLFAPPAGEGITFNSNRASVILRSADPLRGEWGVACVPGFGDAGNKGIFETVVFNGNLYAGTFNHLQGYQIWKTPATGSAPCRWTKVIERGAYRGPYNEIAMSMCVFNGALYVGSAIQNGGYDRVNRVGPAAGEIIRIYPDDSWDLLVGTPRRTPQGMKYPLSGMGPGFDNIFAGYIWRMAVYEGWLYVSTFDWSVFLPYAKRPSPASAQLARRFGIDRIVEREGGFDLWRTRDGVHWIPVTWNGLGNPYNYGGRTLLSTPHGLFVGTANPFGPEVAAKLSSGWIYVTNPNGGAEVWLGRQTESTGNTVREGSRNDSPVTDIRSRMNGNSFSEKAGLSQPAAKASSDILLTGGAGFIGSHLLEKLLTQGRQIRVLALPETVAALPHSDRVEVIAADLLNEEALLDAVAGVETIYHLAALLPGSPYQELMNVNVHGTENLLRAAKRGGQLKRFVFTSSVAVYGGAFQPGEWPFYETSPLLPRGPRDLRDYGHTKVAAESLVQRYAQDSGFEYVILRPSTSYGKGGKFSEDLVRRVLSDSTAGTGPLSTLAMQLIHVRDLAEGILLAGQALEAANQVFNLAGLEGPSFRRLAALIRRLKGIDTRDLLIPDPLRGLEHITLAYEMTKAQRILGFRPRYTVQEGFAELVAEVDWDPRQSRRSAKRKR